MRTSSGRSSSLLRSLFLGVSCRLIRSHRDAVAIQMSVGQMFMSNAQQIKCLAWQCPRQCHRWGCRLPATAAAASKRSTLGDQSGWVFHNFYELHTRCGMSRLPLKLRQASQPTARRDRFAVNFLDRTWRKCSPKNICKSFLTQPRSHVVVRHPSSAQNNVTMCN